MVIAQFDSVYKVVTLENRAFATSGDYRNYFEANGRTYSHIIDPRTGRPVADRVAAVSVVADTCMMADGLATAMMVMGAKQSIALAERLENTACMVVERKKDGKLVDSFSKGFILSD